MAATAVPAFGARLTITVKKAAGRRAGEKEARQPKHVGRAIGSRKYQFVIAVASRC
jgi:hypothetical protein